MTSDTNSHPPRYTEAGLPVIRRFMPTLDTLKPQLSKGHSL